ncbi:type II secretion system F family protein [Candidatus Nitrosopumilus sediminis]|uniref:Type II secretion system F protein n=1 Tax=Candidatus Nitrosopumilus sediminis TaxID=1229909 RepID=K0BBZ8_9ARCH|nr:type II secretion system F family protein [Candidatus Nitrosopumilus sediminis]AFS82979.1 Type II secretion system F protein [Candidatus Nitrosopumilus sediminis]
MSQKIQEESTSTSKLNIKSAWNSVFEDINNDVLFSGKPLDTLVFLERIRKSIIISAIIMAPVSVFLYVMFSPIFLALNLVSVLIFAYPKIQQSSLSKERKKKVEEELPSFVIFSSVLQNVGVGLYDSFQLFSQTGLFKSIGKEALLLKRNVDQFGISQMEALEELGRTHKSDQFKNLLLGYTSIWRSGGDLSLYLESRAEEFFTNLKDRYQAYTNSVGTIVEVLVTLLIILPIMIMVSSFVLPGSSMEQVTLLATVGIPIFAIVMGVAISSMQPASFNKLGLHPRTTILLTVIGIISGSLTYYATNQTWIAISLGILIPSIISAIITGKQTKEINSSEQSLPQFLRDMTEYKKIGYDVILAIIHLSKENLYNSIFNKRIGEVSILLDNGISPITSVKSVQFRSWFTKISFYLLGYVAEFGGGNPRTLETVNRFITTAKQVVKEGKSSISMLAIVIFAAPVIMAFTATMILGIMDSFESSPLLAPSGNIENKFGSIPGMNTDFTNLVTITPEFMEMTKTLIITSSMLSAFVISKAIDFSFYNTWRVVVIGIIAIASVVMMDSFSGLSLSLDNIFGGAG